MNALSIMRRLLAIFTIGATLLAPALAQTRPVQVIEADRVIAIVNNEAITANELKSRLAMVERQLKSQGTPLPPHDQLTAKVLERMVMERIQIQFARDTATRVDDTQLDDALRRIAERNKLGLSEFRATLERDGIRWSKFREEIRDEMIIERLRDREVNNRIAVSEGEIDNYLSNPENTSDAGVQLNLAHIIVRVPEQASPDQLVRIRGKVEQALAQIKRGDDFGKVAASFSDAPDALSGGGMGLRPADRLPGLYSEAALKMKPGEVSEILRSPAGFHLIKLIDRQGGNLAAQKFRQTHARHILIKTDELIPEAEAKRKIMALKERLDNGTDFAELARMHSNDSSAAKGGDLGWLYQGDTVPDFEKPMDALKINEISQPVRSPFGWHIIQVLERKEEDASQERRRLIARQALRERKMDESYEDWLRQLRDSAYVEYRTEER